MTEIGQQFVDRQKWIEEADRRIEQAKRTIQVMHETSSCEAFWPRVKGEAQAAVETIKFLEAGKRFVQEPI